MINKATVDAVVAILKSLEVDGETMEFIIAEVGMTDQMVKQLYHDKQDQGPEVDGAGFTESDREQIYTFTKEELIIFSAKLIERTLGAVEEIVDETTVEDDDLVELDFDYRDNKISWTINQRVIQTEMRNNIHSQIDTDNDTVETEVNNILSLLTKG
jgi:hypothetical protein